MRFVCDSVFSARSILSTVGGAFLPMFDTLEALKLRLVCLEFRESVAENHDGLSLLPRSYREHSLHYQRHKFDGMCLVHFKRVPTWRACFPNAPLCRVSGIIEDASLLKGLRCVDLSAAEGVLDSHLLVLGKGGVITLKLMNCSNITDTGFQNFEVLQSLTINLGYENKLTGTMFTYLKSLKILHINGFCPFTDATFTPLARLRELYLG